MIEINFLQGVILMVSCVYVCMFVHIDICAYNFIYEGVYVYICIGMCIYNFTYIYICILTRIQMHKHKPGRTLVDLFPCPVARRPPWLRVWSNSFPNGKSNSKGKIGNGGRPGNSKYCVYWIKCHHA